MANVKNNLRAVTNPAITDDSSQGYTIGSDWFNVATGRVWRCLSNTPGNARWIRVEIAEVPWPKGSYRTPEYISGIGDAQVAPNVLAFLPLKIDAPVTIDAIAFAQVAGQTGGAIRIGIYDTNADDVPGSLIVDAGEVDISSGSTPFIKQRVISMIDLGPGVYWLASVSKAVATQPTLRRVSNAPFGVFASPTPMDWTSTTPTAFRYRSAAFTYGALPTTAPTTTPSAGGDGVVLALRRAVV